MGITRQILLRASRSKWLADQISRRNFAQRAVRRFMPGETLEAALQATAALVAGNRSTILTLLGENVSSAETAEAIASHYHGSLSKIHDLGYDSDISLKPTQLGLDLDFERTAARFKGLVEYAAQLGRTVAIDMEDSSYVDRTLELYLRLSNDFPNTTVCLQAYLLRTPSDLEALLPTAPAIRLVKGAYNEPRNLAFHRKRDVDAAFLRLAHTLLQARADDARVRVFFGTHDPHMIDAICHQAEALGLSNDSFEFQMLYGIQRELQIRLAADGYRVRVLISYGDSWFPWYMRRLAERPANLTFLLKNILSR